MAWRRKSRSSPEKVASAWRRALRAAVAGDWPAVETWLERIVEADSTDFDAYHALARLYREQGAVGRSIRMHQNLLLRADLEPESRLEAMRELARDFEAGGFSDRAIAAYEEVLDRRPRDVETLERLIELLGRERETARALALTRRLRRRNRDLADRLGAELLLAQARLQDEQGDHDGARRSLKRCLKRAHSDLGILGEAWGMLGDLEAQRGRDARALDAWKQGVAADPSYARSLYPKIEATYVSRGKLAEYERYLRGVLEDRPQDCDARLALVRAIVSRGDSKTAVEELSRAIEVAPDHLGLRAALGRELLASGQDAEALKAYADLVDTLERLSLGDDRGLSS
jgi:lipopolysaccharide biosynthesis regulator YciM